MRRAVYDRLSGLHRAELHLRIAEVLEGEPRPRPAELAHHFAAAIPLASADRAVRYHRPAADDAMARLAYDVTAEHLRTALELGVGDVRDRAELELWRGEALMRAGAALDALEAYRNAAAIGRAEGDGELLARAAIGFEETCWRPAFVDLGARELLEEALASLRPSGRNCAAACRPDWLAPATSSATSRRRRRREPRRLRPAARSTTAAASRRC